ncbi:MAG TPA: DUF3179 domain-containing (seleno)protein [Puia sp.]
MKRLLFIPGLLLLFATEILRVYFIMPFPGSQQSNTIQLAYFIDRNRILLRVIGLLLIVAPFLSYWRRAGRWKKMLLGGLALFYGVIFYFFNFRFSADKMFYQPGVKTFAAASANTIPLSKLVIGVALNGEAKAYPIQVIGYHHQVRDTIGGVPVIVTYCTVCRTGRVFSPTVNGRPETFRLVGMDHFNAMFEDEATHSWWQQATGVAVAGPLKNTQLAELPSAQSSLSEWLQRYPGAKILQRDTVFNKRYESLADYDNGTIKGSLEKRDSASWKPKSWVVGVLTGNQAKAYDWNELVSHPLIQDTIGSLPVAILLSADSSSFRTWSRQLQGHTLQFEKVSGERLLKDTNTGSSWNSDGLCVEGKLKDQQLAALPAYQEFWHSWSHFHPATTRYQ